MARPERLSAAGARRIALAAQGLASPRPVAPPDRRALHRLVDRLGLFQIDSVNVLARAHYLPAFSRLGDYPTTLLDDAAWGPRRARSLFEYWAHAASLMRVDLQPLLRWRMAQAEAGERTWGGLKDFAGPRRAEADAVLARIAAEGPLAASDFQADRGPGGWWGWSEPKKALEWLFWAGRITTATRRGAFERVYDLTERVLPSRILATPTPAPADAQRHLVRLSAAALGVATALDLRDYFRLPPEDFRPRLQELVEAGELTPVQVEGWDRPAFLWSKARLPRRVEGRALLAPFDPLVWERARAERLFGLRYRIGIYTPAHLREHGYYVLPFLLGDRIAARVDLKADRALGVLRVQAAHAEPDPPQDLAPALADELHLMARWLGLAEVEVAGAGALAPTLQSALRHPGSLK